MIDFTAFKHPVLAVACPDCKQRAGSMCKRPSGHGASDFHKARKDEADRVFIVQHGENASIDKGPNGWWIDPRWPVPNRSANHQQQEAKPRQLSLFAGET